MNVAIKRLNDKAILPEYQTLYAAAMDIHACIDEPRVLQAGERALIPTGLALEIPIGYEMQVRPRSGLSFKYGIAMTNGVGTVDADYRGELGVPLINLGQEPFTIEPGMRIAQAVVAAVERVEWQEAETLSETDRGQGGFGSTGLDKTA